VFAANPEWKPDKDGTYIISSANSHISTAMQNCVTTETEVKNNVKLQFKKTEKRAQIYRGQEDFR